MGEHPYITAVPTSRDRTPAIHHGPPRRRVTFPLAVILRVHRLRPPATASRTLPPKPIVRRHRSLVPQPEMSPVVVPSDHYRGGVMRSVTYSMSVSLHWLHRWAGRRLRLDGARRGGLWLLDRQVPIGRRPPAGTTAVRNDAVLGDRRPGSDARRPELEWAAIWKPLPKVVFPITLRRRKAMPARSPAAWRRRSSACEPSRGRRHRDRRRELAGEAAAAGLVDNTGQWSTRCRSVVAFRSLPNASAG
jgi:hypothetical protein